MRQGFLPVAFLCLFLIGSAEVVAGPMMGQMGRHFGVPSGAIASLPAVYGLCYGVVALVAGPLSDRLGRKRPLQWGLAGFALLSALMPQAPHLTVAVVLAGLSGVCGAVIQPNVFSMVADEVGPEAAGRRLGQVLVGLMLAFVITPALAGWAADAWGWAAAYRGLAWLAALAWGGVSLAFPAAAPGSGAGQPAGFWAVHRAALAVPQARRRLLASYLWLGWVAGFGAIVAEVCARQWHLSPTAAGLLAAYWGVVVIAGNLVGGWLQGHLRGPVLPLLASGSALGVLAFAWSGLPVWALMALGAVWAFGYGGAGPLHHARLSSLSDTCRGTINSYHASLLNLGIFSVSILLGLMSTGDAWWASLPVFCVVVALLAGLGASLLWVSGRGAIARRPG